MDGETELEQEQFRNGSARKNISAAICADEISFRERGTEMEKRNWNKETELEQEREVRA